MCGVPGRTKEDATDSKETVGHIASRKLHAGFTSPVLNGRSSTPIGVMPRVCQASPFISVPIEDRLPLLQLALGLARLERVPRVED